MLNYEENYEEIIGRAEVRLKKAQQDVEDAEYIKKLVHADLIKTIRSCKTIWDYCDSVIAKAQTQVGKRYKKERPDFEFIQSKVREEFFSGSKAIKIIGIVRGGCEGYYWSFALDTGDKEEYFIEVPMREKITIGNADFAGMGKFRFLLRTSPCCVSVQFSSYDNADFAKKVEDYFRKKATI